MFREKKRELCLPKEQQQGLSRNTLLRNEKCSARKKDIESKEKQLPYYEYYTKLWFILLHIPISKAEVGVELFTQAAVTLKLKSKLVVSQDFVHAGVSFVQ